MIKKKKLFFGFFSIIATTSILAVTTSCSFNANDAKEIISKLNSNNTIKGNSSVFPTSITNNDLILSNLDKTTLPSADNITFSYLLVNGGNPDNENGTLQIKVIATSKQGLNSSSFQSNTLIVNGFATLSNINDSNTRILKQILNTLETRVDENGDSTIIKARSTSTSNGDNPKVGTNTLPSEVSQINLENNILISGLTEFQNDSASQNKISLTLTPILVQNELDDNLGKIKITIEANTGSGDTSVIVNSKPISIKGFLTIENSEILQKNKIIIDSLTKEKIEANTLDINFLNDNGKKLLPSSLRDNNFLFFETEKNNSNLVMNYKENIFTNLATSNQNTIIEAAIVENSNILQSVDDLNGTILLDFKISLGDIEKGTFYEKTTLKSIKISGFNKSINFNNITFNSDNLEYKIIVLNNGEIIAEVNGFEENLSIQPKNIEILETVEINGNIFKIISINESAFSEKNINSIDLSKATNLKNIADNAFSKNNITQIIIPNSLVQIGKNAFSNNKIEVIDFLNASTSKLQLIDDKAFFNNYLKAFKVSGSFSNLTNINFHAFANDNENHAINSTITLESIIEFLNNFTFNQTINISEGAFINSKTNILWKSYDNKFEKIFKLKNNIKFVKADDISNGLNSSFGNSQVNSK